MSTFAKPAFDALAYAASRPQYPPQLFRHILIYTNQTLSNKSLVLPAPRTLVDIGCGPGLSTFAFAPSFNKLVGIDPSAKMVDAAQDIAREKSLELADKEIEFVVGFGEDLSRFADGSVDLVVAGQAAHWFEMPKVYRELRRVLKPNGCFAFWGYGEFFFPTFPKLTTMIPPYSAGILGPYWQQPGRSHVEKLLDPLPFPSNRPSEFESAEYIAQHGNFGSFERWKFVRFGEPQPPIPRHPPPPARTADKDLITEREYPILLKVKWTFAELEAYLRTWSAAHTYDEKHYPNGGSVVDSFKEAIWAGFTKSFIKRKKAIPISWKMGMMLGRKEALPKEE